MNADHHTIGIFFEVPYYILYPLGGALMALLQGNLGLAQIRVARAFGRLQGWRVRPDHKVGSPYVDANGL
jgi:hypothetical protein